MISPVVRVLAVAAGLVLGVVQISAEQLDQNADLPALTEPGLGVAVEPSLDNLGDQGGPTTSITGIVVPPLLLAADSALPALAPRPRSSQSATPEPQHSGWGALFKQTLGDFATFPQRPSTWVILGVGGGGALLAHPADDYVVSHIVGSTTADRVFALGKWVGSAYVQGGTAIGVYLIGRYVVAPAPDGSRTNKWSHLGFDLIRAQLLSQGLVQGIKYSVQRDRPSGACCAFPSGHAAAAFVSASVLERHFGYRGAWPAMVAASYVAASRLVDNQHFLSDVVFGSAVGIASGWTVVGDHGRSTFSLVPTPVRGGVFLAFTRNATPAGR